MKRTSRQKLLLPHECERLNPGSESSLAARRRALPLLAALVGAAISAALWRGFHDNAWQGPVMIGAMTGGMGFLIWHGIVTGYLHTNHGVFSRVRRPVAFWITTAFWIGVYLAFFGVLLFADL